MQDLIKTIKAHIAKGDKAADKAEQHYIAAGQHLKTLKAEHTGSWSEWEALLRERVGIGKSRASELMAIADGTKTLAEVRATTADRTAKAKLSATSGDIPVDVLAYVAKDLGISWEEAYPLITRDDDRTFHYRVPGTEIFPFRDEDGRWMLRCPDCGDAHPAPCDCGGPFLRTRTIVREPQAKAITTSTA
jgi:hypothetical protein